MDLSEILIKKLCVLSAEERIQNPIWKTGNLVNAQLEVIPRGTFKHIYCYLSRLFKSE